MPELRPPFRRRALRARTNVYPATADHPVRVDLWGDELDRLSRFSVADQRSIGEIGDAWIFECMAFECMSWRGARDGVRSRDHAGTGGV